ncbi:ATP synthase subunit f, mitochondrial isoform X1 [Python bivittatus]|uniref:ATP synthase F(0) complex subunit f, mitochondrial n=2 Tax=Python bivittatus TaxID=176946 RepID=A0A9F5IEC2_PYTBI|nr:ATP synthase subunit f, mitochondrial isoform X1 [Python bivittatus]
MAGRPVPIKDMKLLDVKLGQLPSWLASLNYTPRAMFEACRRGHNRFYSKYWDVKKCGISGPAILITAYVIFSYYTVYDHLKEERWRKYH